MIALLSAGRRRRIRREARAVAEALAALRKARPRADHFTGREVAKAAGLKDAVAVRRIVRDHRVELLRQSRALGSPLARAPFWADGAVWL